MDSNEPVRRRVRLAHRNGLHLTPITELVRRALEFDSDIKICFDGKVASARSAMELMLLGATHGAELTIEGRGRDVDPAITALSRILEAVEPR